MQKEFSYKFNDGPLESESTLSADWKTGNCRRAVQYYVWKKLGKFLKPEQVLCPAGYYNTGSFVVGDKLGFTFDLLKDGDIIYAESIRNKDDKIVDKSESVFKTDDDYIISLHTALFTGHKDSEIWHATAIEGKSCFWPKDKFLHYYRPIAAKRI